MADSLTSSFASFASPRWTVDWVALVQALVALAVAIAIALVLHRLLFVLLSRLAKASSTPLDEMVFQRIRRPLAWAMVGIAVSIVAPIQPQLAALWNVLSPFAVPLLLGWIAYALVKGFAHAMQYRAEIAEDPVAARSSRTRIAILSRTAIFAIIFVTTALMLLGIPGVRDIGVTLMASAGLAALAVGAAAQPALKSLIAGLQMAITEPLRIGDLVVVDGYTGRVEEITMSYVVVRIWDERVIIVPTNRFLEESFENWSRSNEKLTGPVLLHLDPIAEIDPIRAEFMRFLKGRKEWDGRSADVLMTEAMAESIELRLSMSAATIAELFDLRCAVREHMVGWLRKEMPDALIRRRLEVDDANRRARREL